MAIAAAFISGLANGLFGGGAGTLVVPSLKIFRGLDQKEAHATAISVVLPLSVFSTVYYTLSGNASWSYFLPVGSGVVIGGALGALLLAKVPKKVLTLVFYLVMIYAGVRMIAL